MQSLEVRNAEYIVGMRQRRERRLAARSGHQEVQTTERVTITVPQLKTEADWDDLITNFRV